MKITWKKVKQYNSTKKFVIMVDGEPVCICKREKTAADIISYLEGYNVEIKDGKIKKILDKIREREGGKCHL